MSPSLVGKEGQLTKSPTSVTSGFDHGLPMVTTDPGFVKGQNLCTLYRRRRSRGDVAHDDDGSSFVIRQRFRRTRTQHAIAMLHHIHLAVDRKRMEVQQAVRKLDQAERGVLRYPESKKTVAQSGRPGARTAAHGSRRRCVCLRVRAHACARRRSLRLASVWQAGSGF